jgi:RNA polymerase sigma-70 factor, ECF subfamily
MWAVSSRPKIQFPARINYIGGCQAEGAAPMISRQDEVTAMLHELENGHASAAERLLPLVYDEMRLLAESFFRTERTGHTLQPTALVHEAYLRLVNERTCQWNGKAHFMAIAAQAMRRILINHAEAHRAAKRGGGWNRITLSEVDDAEPPTDVDLLDLDDALDRLERLDARQCRVVELRFFGGMSVEQAAGVLNISTRQVELDWRMARAWLFGLLNR